MTQKKGNEFREGRIAFVWSYNEDDTLKQEDINSKTEALVTPMIGGEAQANAFVKGRKVIIISRFVSHFVVL